MGVAGLSHAESPLPLAVFRYSEQEGRYVPASARYTWRVLADAQERLSRLEGLERRRTRGDPSVRGALRATVLALLLDRIYAGRRDAAWALFERAFAFPDREAVRAEIERRIDAPVYESIYPDPGS